MMVQFGSLCEVCLRCGLCHWGVTLCCWVDKVDFFLFIFHKMLKPKTKHQTTLIITTTAIYSMLYGCSIYIALHPFVTAARSSTHPGQKVPEKRHGSQLFQDLMQLLQMVAVQVVRQGCREAEE
jgi:hypothetical protein